MIYVLGAVVVWLVVLRLILNPYLAKLSAERPIPELGRRAKVYKFLSHKLVHVHYVPKLSKEEIAVREAEAEAEAAAEAEEAQYRQTMRELWTLQAQVAWLMKRLGSVEIAFLSSRGGLGRGTSAINMALAIYEATGIPVLVMDTRHTPGNLGPKMGVQVRRDSDDINYVDHRSTPTIRQCMRLFAAGKFKSAVETFKTLGFMPGHTIAVIAADYTEQGKPARPDIVVEEFDPMMQELRQHFPLVIHELSNTVADLLDNYIVTHSGVVVFVHNPTFNSIFMETLSCINAYRTNPDFGQRVTRNAILIATEALDTDTPAKFNRYGIDEDRTFVIPFNQYFVGSGVRDDDKDDNEPVGDTSSTVVPEPLYNEAAMPLNAKITYLSAVRAALVPLLSEEYTEEFAALEIEIDA
jgi:hypothetical protein